MTRDGENKGASADFAALPESDWRALAAYVEPVECRAGEPLFSEGEAASGLYFFLDGRFAVQKKGELPGKMQTVALLAGGSVAGEGALVGIARHRASLLCLESGRALCLTTAAHVRLREENPRLCLTLLHYLLRISALRLSGASERLAVLL
ncbi:MAG: cyclic nucleotide-binding domain-containing protein [Desulfobulbaceae bacterium]|jgi:CRP-like cAMP-binding protein|nr:cyclic nucleotide-binding domain-containing protein [Desulfobulbaceae bacterium]